MYTLSLPSIYSTITTAIISFYDIIKHKLLHNFVVLNNFVGLKSGRVEVWQSGSLAVWKCGSLAVWKCGSLALWKCGSLAKD